MATNKIGYGTEVGLTFTSLDSLASSSGLTAGAESAALDNTTTLAVDYLISGMVKVNGSNAMTANTTLEVWVIAEREDTPAYPDVFDGTDSAETVTSRNVLFAAGKLAAVVTFDGTDTNRVYDIGQFSLAQLFGGNVPRHCVLFVVHNGGQALNSTGNGFYAMPILPTVA